MARPNVTHYTLCEGAPWMEFHPATRVEQIKFAPHAVHAIKFDNGDVWDTINGWRNKEGQKT